MSVDFGRRVVTLRAGRRVSGRFALRPALICLVLAVAALAVGVLALGTGEFTLTPGQVLEALAGEGTRAARLVVVDWRLPRVLLALIIGAALGLAGAIFQALTRNPLGSPDVIGFNTGAYTGVLIVTVFAGNGYYLVATGALAGGLITALLVYLLAFRRGVQGFRLIIVGIAVSAMLTSANQWFLIKMDLQAAYAASMWGQGSLNGLGWAQVTPVAAGVGVLCLVLIAYGPRLALLEMGDDAAAALGVRVEPVRLAYLIIGVALTAVATAAAGPVSFVALAAPQLARRLTGTPGIALVPSAAMGALLLMVSDWLAQRAFAPTQLPVGVVTVSVGGLYFVWLLVRQARR
ncbi:FecCD family ABC transporter permease [Pseudosporangium ferrugineum]|uniref:Iron complex transport system permease protein n=1 Tax=Pseudosporangium ferrugineum TaxID=439699 RepID=A0A2T0RS58_9ACTN|nr:iron chelate uptake ABC transporter family permease subunit [Pseudosporangium ferrugineum]PRY23991.1 iron complex transport system permease protein [Pseudosporangium ferrugineum]